MNKKKVDIESSDPINRAAEVDEVVAAFVKRGGYITIEEDLRIRKRISNRAHLAYWIGYVKSKLVYKKQNIVKHVAQARDSFKGKISSKITHSPIVKSLVKEKHDDETVLKRSLNIDSYSDICKEDSTLRPYQQKAKKEIFESWDEVDNVMFQMPTGTGKTRLFTSIIRDINQYSLSKREAVKILIIAHRTELIDQIDESLKKYHIAHNVIGGSKKKRDEDKYVHVSSIKEIALAKKLNEKKFPVHVASIQTIMHKRNLNDTQKLNFQFIIIDEAHHALADTYMRLWKLYPGSKKLGVTATPWRMNHQSFTDLFDKLVMSMPIKDFIKQGYLSPYVYYSLRDESYIQKTIDGIELDKFGEYDEESLEENMDIGKIRAQLLSSYQSLAKGKKGIIYAINKKHAKNICREFEDAGYRVVAIDSETPDADRKEMVKSFKKGEIDIIVNVDIFSEGFDCPDIEFIQLARPTRSLVKYLQQVGRGLRITGSKGHCIILDNVGMYSRFGLPDARRHWKYHFLGHDVEDEEEPKRSSSKGTGKPRNQDISEGTEDMELIQDVSGDVEVNESQPDSIDVFSSAIDNFFPLFGITLGKTTWKDAKDMGIKVKKFENDQSRNINVEDVDFWDHDGVGIFTSVYWTNDESDFPASWKLKGFDWNLSYDKWIEVFEKLGYDISVTRQPSQSIYSRRNTLNAEFEALSPDKTLRFTMDFNYGENGYYTLSPKTLYSITVNYEGVLVEKTEDIDIDEKTEDVEGLETIDSEDTNNATFDLSTLFPLWGITPGKTTWKDAENMGHKVEIWKNGPARTMGVNGVDIWDHDGIGVFNHIYWVHFNCDFPDYWKSIGFSWDNSYDVWISLFKGFGYEIRIIEEPTIDEWKGNRTLNAEFLAISPNKDWKGRMLFRYGKDGFSTSSPNTLYSITIMYVVPVNPSKDVVKIFEPEIVSLPQRDIFKLRRVFDSKATCYKYFWFMSIMHLLYETEEAEIDFNKILIKMVANAWKYVFVEDGEFSLSDQLPLYLQSIKIRTHLKSKSSEEEVERVVAEQYDKLRLGKILSPLLKNVPYRFLSPWIRFSGNNDVMAKSQISDVNCLYELHNDHITIKELWKDYLFEHYDEVIEYIESNLRQYLNI